MGSRAAQDGLLPGSYKVAILGYTEYAGGDNICSLLDPKGTSPPTTDDTVDVQKTTRNVMIKVDRNPETLEQFKSKR